MTFRERDVLFLDETGFHRLVYSDWGLENAPQTVICIHGLTGTGRDFDRLAERLTADGSRRLLCPDMPGRGRSDWMPNATGYGFPTYLNACTALIAASNARSVDWIGTSMGGIIGMLMAAQPGTPVRRLILNDVGAFIPKAALQRIGSYVGKDPRFDSLPGVEAYLREVHAPFGPMTDDDWRHMTQIAARPVEEGGYALHYDPAIGTSFQDPNIADADLWPVWHGISCPTLLIR
ncbi:MAG: alpha/beta fold hydrolase, partial [Magnetospiraceae bacterium]